MDRSDRHAQLERLFHAHAGAVRAYARRRTDPASADDVVMEVFVVACRRLDDVPEEPLPWLLGCARRVLANQRRGARRRQALAGRMAAAGDWTAAGPATPAELPGTHQAVLIAVERLGERDREILHLHAWEGLEPPELATVLGCSAGAARVRLHRARRRLARQLEAGGSQLGTDPPAKDLVA